jgi:predicted RNA-binding protein with PIN domain
VTPPNDDGEAASVALPGLLPGPVRTRVLALAADALGRLPADQVPPALRRVASFAPARRARLAGNRIAAVLEADEPFRLRLADQLAETGGDVASAVASGAVPSAADPVELAAAAYLLRPEGWPALVAAAEESARGSRESAEAAQADEVATRLRRQVAELQEDTQRLRRRHREQADGLRAENDDLRRRVRDLRHRVREAEGTVASARESAEAEVRAAEQRVAAAEADVRRLRARVAEVEAELATARRAERAERVDGAVRARLLLDAVVQAAQGLQRELGLPAVERLPADTVAARVAEEGVRPSAGRGSLPTDDPGLVEELLRLPRAHLIVDGYNVTKTAWPELPLERQRDRLVTRAAALMARTGAETTIVFDAAATRHRPVVPAPRGLRVLFSPYGVIADDVIRDLVAAEPPGRNVVVVSSDQAVARDVVAAGFRVVAAEALAQLLSR